MQDPLMVSAIAVCGSVLLLVGCQDSTAPSRFIRNASAVVALGAESCPLTLRIGSLHYVPIGLPRADTVLGLRLRVSGVVHDVPSTCMVGPGLELTAVSRE
jgi:hypothetical protein